MLRRGVAPRLPSFSERSFIMSKNQFVEILFCLHPRHALYPFYRTPSFSRRSARLRFAGRWMFSRFQRTRDHPLTRSLQSLSDTGPDRCDFVINIELLSVPKEWTTAPFLQTGSRVLAIFFEKITLECPGNAGVNFFTRRAVGKKLTCSSSGKIQWSTFVSEWSEGYV